MQSPAWLVDAHGNALGTATVGGVSVLKVDVVAGGGSSSTNTNGSQTTANVSTVATITVPANAVGFLLEAKDSNSANIRWAVGGTASSTVGQQLQAGRDTGYIPIAANISICAESGTQEYQIQWVLSS